jgi:hypothetical protein
MDMSKRALQIVTGLLGVVPLVTGLLGLMGVADPFYVAIGVPPIVVLDTNLRFYSGVWLGLGLAFLWLIPAIERQTVLFRVLWGMIFIGGIGRLLSMMRLGWPPVAFVAFTAIEIVGAPLFIWWQSRVSKYVPVIRRTSSTAMSQLLPVDRLEVLVLVDNLTDSLSSNAPFVVSEWLSQFARRSKEKSSWPTILTDLSHDLQGTVAAKGASDHRCA